MNLENKLELLEDINFIINVISNRIRKDRALLVFIDDDNFQYDYWCIGQKEDQYIFKIAYNFVSYLCTVKKDDGTKEQIYSCYLENIHDCLKDFYEWVNKL